MHTLINTSVIVLFFHFSQLFDWRNKSIRRMHKSDGKSISSLISCTDINAPNRNRIRKVYLLLRVWVIVIPILLKIVNFRKIIQWWWLQKNFTFTFHNILISSIIFFLTLSFYCVFFYTSSQMRCIFQYIHSWMYFFQIFIIFKKSEKKIHPLVNVLENTSHHEDV